MEKEKIDQFLMINGKNFPEIMQQQIRNKLASLDESKASMVLGTEWKSPTIGFLLAFFLGSLGVDRFWLGQTGLGILKLVTCGGAGLWSLIDLFTVFGRTKNFNLQKLMMNF
ncbi:MAG: TM2 domain-containing protein [Paludibacteraceae bacterium]|nr:TM2 domain-containing protein [Paludibacteraceae bacterium]